jgi:uncharacterized membrane protein YkvA (DUF1232 family)
MKAKSTTFQANSGKAPIGPFENIRLTWRLLRDPKVAPYAKVLLPILALVYLISPIDLIPDMILGLGQIDDVGVIAILSYFLVSFVRKAGWSTMQQTAPTNPPQRRTGSENVIDATYCVISDARPKNEPNPTQKK